MKKNDLAILLVYFNLRKNPLVRQQFEQTLLRCRAAGDVFAAEISYDGKPDFAGYDVLQFTAKTPLWHKENLLNLLLGRLPEHYTKVAWVDGDVTITCPDWAKQTSKALNKAAMMQLGETFLFLDRSGTPHGRPTQTSLAAAMKYQLPHHTNMAFYHPGLAWAIRRDVLREVGGFPHLCLAGEGDAVMALGAIESAWPDGSHSPNWVWREQALAAINHEYKQMTLDYAQMLATALRGHKLDCLPGVVVHHYHADYRKRNYVERLRIMRSFSASQFYRNSQGALETNNLMLVKEYSQHIQQRES